jgi:hypothetical protein
LVNFCQKLDPNKKLYPLLTLWIQEKSILQWRSILGKLLITIAATILMLEIGEFLLLVYSWMASSEFKSIQPPISTYIVCIGLISILSLVPACFSAIASLVQKRLYPSPKYILTFSIVAFFIQSTLLIAGTIGSMNTLVDELLRTKIISFAAAGASALILALAVIITRRD